MDALDLAAAINAASAALAAEDRANWGYDHDFEVSDLGRGDAESEAFARAAVVAAAPHILAAAGKVISEDHAREIMDEHAKALIAGARADERTRIAALVEDYAANYPEDVFPPSSDSRDAIGGTAMRHAYRNAARMIREQP